MSDSDPAPSNRRTFVAAVRARASGLSVYGLAPPKSATSPDRLVQIAQAQSDRIDQLGPDALIVYDLQDEADRTSEPRPFPFLPTIDPAEYANRHLTVPTSKIIYRCVGADSVENFSHWLDSLDPAQHAVVLVGSPASKTQVKLSLSDAYVLASEVAPDLLVGGIAIAERHKKRGDEHERMAAKMKKGCRFFVTQAVYDVTATKSLISDFHYHLDAEEVPLILTFAPCASPKTLAFMKWLGISFPRWLENELTHAEDPLQSSLHLCERIFDEVWTYATEKAVPIGINVESVSIRRAEIDASVRLFEALRGRMSS